MSASILVVAAASAAAQAAPMPDIARAMIDAAAASGQASQVIAVANAARAVFPDSADAIDAYATVVANSVIAAVIDDTDDHLVVVAKPAEEKVAPKLDDEVDEHEFKPGKAPAWLKLGPWKGRATASGLLASGNSKNAAAGFKVDARREFTYFTHNISAYIDYGKSRGVKSQQRWGAAYKLDYLVSDSTYAYSRVSYDEDQFSGYDYKLFGGLGLGHRFFDEKSFKLRFEGGPGYQYAPIDDSREIEQRFAAYLSGKLEWIIMDGLKFDQNADFTWTEASSSVISNSAITVALTDTLSTGVSFLYRYETNPPMNRLNTDTTFRMNLTYGF